ncbi:hypothetical protein J437_LFUL016494, partial [Ladona fulva]
MRGIPVSEGFWLSRKGLKTDSAVLIAKRKSAIKSRKVGCQSVARQPINKQGTIKKESWLFASEPLSCDFHVLERVTATAAAVPTPRPPRADKLALVQKEDRAETADHSDPSKRPNSLQRAPNCRDAETITDVCSGANIPEVEIISLVEEQIPKYRLRADTITDFAGYENSDFAASSKDPGQAVLDLSPEQIRETLNYFRESTISPFACLCALRLSFVSLLSQMW